MKFAIFNFINSLKSTTDFLLVGQHTIHIINTIIYINNTFIAKSLLESSESESFVNIQNILNK